MATSIGQYAPVFLPGEHPLPDREAWQATVYRVAKSWTLPMRPCVHRRKTLFACGSSTPVRIEHEGGTAAWLAGTLAAPVVQGHKLPVPQELWPYLLGVFFVCFFCLFVLVFLNLLNLVIRTLWPVFLHSSAPSGT